jgi:hypothetical protein
MKNLFSVNNVAFTVFGYPLSYIELVGTVFYLWSVWLIARRRIWTWPIGIVAVILYMLIFYQIRLYSDALEQVYYLVASVYGWWHWLHSPREGGTIVDVGFSNTNAILLWLIVSVVLGIGLGAFMSRAPSLAAGYISGSGVVSLCRCAHDDWKFHCDVANGAAANRELGVLDCHRRCRHRFVLREGSEVHRAALCGVAGIGDQGLRLMVQATQERAVISKDTLAVIEQATLPDLLVSLVLVEG